MCGGQSDSEEPSSKSLSEGEMSDSKATDDLRLDLNMIKACHICQGVHSTLFHVCSVCLKRGWDSHLESDCPERCSICGANHHTMTHRCLLCNYTGSSSHLTKDCPLSIKNDVVCRICGDIEHGWLGCSTRCSICGGCHTILHHQCPLCLATGPRSHNGEDCPRCKICQGLHPSNKHSCPVCHSHQHKLSQCPIRGQFDNSSDRSTKSQRTTTRSSGLNPGTGKVSKGKKIVNQSLDTNRSVELDI